MVNSNGARVFKDFDGRIRAFSDRCESIIWEDSFIRLWLGRTVNGIHRNVAEAREQLHRHELELASERLLFASQQVSWGLLRDVVHLVYDGLPRIEGSTAENGYSWTPSVKGDTW